MARSWLPGFRTRVLTALVVVLLVVGGAGWWWLARGPRPVNVDVFGVAIKGYDPVAYFTEGQARRGSSEFEHVWERARWRFASAAHRDLFAADPDRYAPQFGGY